VSVAFFTTTMVGKTDPAPRPDEPTYECLDCGRHYEGKPDGGFCPRCGGDLHNISVPREQ
jgi:rRNA maturation endonuclease Nob1